MSLYALRAEGISPEDRWLGGPERLLYLDCHLEVPAGKVADFYSNRQAIAAILMYDRVKRMGMPLGPWGKNPEKVCQIIDILTPLDQFYHPQRIL